MLNSLLSVTSQHCVFLHPSRRLFAKHLVDYMYKLELNVNDLAEENRDPIENTSTFWSSDLIFIQEHGEINIPSRCIINICFNGYHQIIEHFIELNKAAERYPTKIFYLLIFEDTVELFQQLAPKNLIIRTLRFPFTTITNELKITEKTIIQLCGECKFAYLKSFQSTTQEFQRLTSIKFNLASFEYSFLRHQECRLSLFKDTIRMLDAKNYTTLISTHRQLAQPYVIFYGSSLLSFMKYNDEFMLVIGNDFVDSGCCPLALRTDYSQSIFKGNFCLDPASHTLHTLLF